MPKSELRVLCLRHYWRFLRRGLLLDSGHGQADLHRQASPRSINRGNFSAVKANRALGNGEPEANASRLASARIIQTVKRLKKFLQGIGWDAGTGVAHSQ